MLAARRSSISGLAGHMGFKILLIEDDRQLAEQLTAQLVRFGHRVALAADGKAAVSLIAKDAFDIVVLDRMLPDVDGLVVLRQLREGGMQVPILMLTALGMTYDKVEGLDAGADDYAVKPLDPLELNARLNALIRARRATGETADTISAGDLVISPSRFRAWRRGQALDLGRTEFKLLLELMRNAGDVVTRPMLVERVWGHDFIPKTNIVTAHVKRLRAKLVQHGDDPIKTVHGMGYLIAE